MAFRWPTDPPGKAPAHTKSWEAHNASSTKPAAAAPVQSPLPLIEPPDASFTAEIEGLGKTYRSDLVGNTEGRKRGLSDYGFTEDETTGGLTFDANNPFSRAALLKKNYDTHRGVAPGRRWRTEWPAVLRRLPELAGSGQPSTNSVTRTRCRSRSASVPAQQHRLDAGARAHRLRGCRQAGSSRPRRPASTSSPLYSPTAERAPSAGAGGSAVSADGAAGHREGREGGRRSRPRSRPGPA
jgi:hypothetical protein